MKKQGNYAELNKIVEFIIENFEVDVTENTKSRKNKLVELRTLFFMIALKTTKLTYDELATFLGKDHSSINHAVKIWDRFIGRIYTDYYYSYVGSRYFSDERNALKIYEVNKQRDKKLDNLVINSQIADIIGLLDEKDKSEVMDKLKIIVKAKIRMNQVEHKIK